MITAACPKISITIIDNLENSSAASVSSKKEISYDTCTQILQLLKCSIMGNIYGFHFHCEIAYAV